MSIKIGKQIESLLVPGSIEELAEELIERDSHFYDAVRYATKYKKTKFKIDKPNKRTPKKVR